MRNRVEAPFTLGTEVPEAAKAAQGIRVGAGSRPVGRTQLGFSLFFKLSAQANRLGSRGFIRF